MLADRLPGVEPIKFVMQNKTAKFSTESRAAVENFAAHRKSRDALSDASRRMDQAFSSSSSSSLWVAVAMPVTANWPDTT